MQQLKYTESNYHHDFLDSLLIFYFLAIQENLYMNRPFKNLLFEDDNTINRRHQN